MTFDKYVTCRVKLDVCSKCDRFEEEEEKDDEKKQCVSYYFDDHVTVYYAKLNSYFEYIISPLPPSLWARSHFYIYVIVKPD